MVLFFGLEVCKGSHKIILIRENLPPAKVCNNKINLLQVSCIWATEKYL